MSFLSATEDIDLLTGVAIADLLQGASELRPLVQSELLQLLDALSNAYQDNAALQDELRQVRLENTEHVLQASGEGRRFRCLLSTPMIEAWLIAWGRSSLLDLHDHGDSSGAVRVFEGVLEERYSDLRSRRPLATRRFGEGSSFSFGVDHVHELGNPSSLPAVSLHVYSPRLTVMNFYGGSGPTFLRPLRREYH